MELNKDFREFVELLNEHGVKYLIIGGYAVNFYGYPRYTKDIDFWVWMTKENALVAIEVIKKFGFSNLKIEIEDFLNPENIIQLGYEPYRIDILMDVKGSNFEDCYEKRTTAILDETTVNFLSLEDLIQVKKDAGRLQDLADAEQLEKIKNKNV
jgi:predicted nucleotidyltransferase